MIVSVSLAAVHGPDITSATISSSVLMSQCLSNNFCDKQHLRQLLRQTSVTNNFCDKQLLRQTTSATNNLYNKPLLRQTISAVINNFCNKQFLQQTILRQTTSATNNWCDKQGLLTCPTITQNTTNYQLLSVKCTRNNNKQHQHSSIWVTTVSSLMAGDEVRASNNYSRKLVDIVREV